jgi:hypothetical protein
MTIEMPETRERCAGVPGRSSHGGGGDGDGGGAGEVDDRGCRRLRRRWRSRTGGAPGCGRRTRPPVAAPASRGPARRRRPGATCTACRSGNAPRSCPCASRGEVDRSPRTLPTAGPGSGGRRQRRPPCTGAAIGMVVPWACAPRARAATLPPRSSTCQRPFRDARSGTGRECQISPRSVARAIASLRSLAPSLR